MNEPTIDVKGKYTPGPLTIHGPSPGGTGMDDGGDYAILDADRKIVAEVIHKVGKDDFRSAKANAELYALAPEMVETIRKIFALHLREVYEATENAEDCWCQTCKILRPLLAKLDQTGNLAKGGE